MNIALIPARGGSKRIPGKNIKKFAGKPIIAWSIAAARESGLFKQIIVSTDSKEIAAVALQHGAEVPFMRPKEISGNYTTTAEVIRHAQEWMRVNQQSPDFICCLYATAPFVSAHNLRRAFDILINSRADTAFPVTSYPFPIFRSLTINEAGRLTMLWPEYELSRSNDLPEAYHDAGQFYWLNSETFSQTGQLYGENAVPLIIPRWLAQDIDTPEDWRMAELLFKSLPKMTDTSRGNHE
ncbi:MAG TPA: pseudaminic acid cytidylyltransferase [Desulfobacterales bacterium]|nr:pseudaminic acid cytidylyltransferase [Desulfobacterales bacterium]